MVSKKILVNILKDSPIYLHIVSKKNTVVSRDVKTVKAHGAPPSPRDLKFVSRPATGRCHTATRPSLVGNVTFIR